MTDNFFFIQRRGTDSYTPVPAEIFAETAGAAGIVDSTGIGDFAGADVRGSVVPVGASPLNYARDPALALAVAFAQGSSMAAVRQQITRDEILAALGTATGVDPSDRSRESRLAAALLTAMGALATARNGAPAAAAS